MTYEQRWGHKRFRKAVKHLEIKAQKRREAEARNAKYTALTFEEKFDRLNHAPGYSTKQRNRLIDERVAK